jgi:thiol-disulfide isomerase/thioredoxin
MPEMTRTRSIALFAILCLSSALACSLSAADAQKAPAAKPADSLAAPEGANKELIEHIKKLRATQSQDPETKARVQASILKTAEKLMSGKATEDEFAYAVQAKMSVLPVDPQKYAVWIDELKKSGHDRWAQRIRSILLQAELRKAMSGHATKSKDLIADVLRFVEEAPPQPADVALAVMAGRLAERSNDGELAINTYRGLAKAFAASKDAKMSELAETFTGVVRRLSLVGNTMTIEGKLLDKHDFDWSKYSGKVVLVDFWATWCGPCVAEIPNIKRCYDLYHAKGFDVVGLSCDRNRNDLERFVKEKGLPWAIVFGDDQPSRTVSYYGIMAIPTMVLVGKDGRVVSLDARGENLKKELTRLLGPVEEARSPKPISRESNQVAGRNGSK